MITHYLRAWREHRGLTQDALAARSGTFPSVISRFESGGRALSLEMSVRLCQALNITLSDLLNAPASASDSRLIVDMNGVKPDKLADFESAVRALAQVFRQG